MSFEIPFHNSIALKNFKSLLLGFVSKPAFTPEYKTTNSIKWFPTTSVKFKKLPKELSTDRLQYELLMTLKIRNSTKLFEKNR
jgi:hypothetical protein